MNEITVRVTSLFVLAVLGYILKILLNLFLARHLPASVYGDYSVAIRVLTILVTLALFGTNIGANRFFAKYLHLNEKTTATSYLAWNIKLLTVTFLIVFILAITSFGVMLTLHHLKIQDLNQYYLVAYVLWLVPFSAIATLMASFVLTSNRILLSSFYKSPLIYLVELTLFSLVVWYIDPGLNNLSIVFVLFLSFVLIIMISTLSINEEILILFRQGFKNLVGTSLSQREWLKTSSSLIANNIVFTVSCTLDLFAVKLFSISETHAGYYAAALSIASILWLIPTNAYQGLKYRLAVLLTREDGREELQYRLNKINALVISLVLVLIFLIAFFAKSLLYYFGPDYVKAEQELIILSIASGIACIGHVAPVLLVFAGYENKVLKWSIINYF
ncbi:oligosaccharide flippase family protein [Legionella drozanskii]|uniref:oligosaccharide flippase family protein n=1 Tax=Legionella drozanskii TaxID=96228 RepID=UPI001041B2EC|nr:oligosaccharide flippase family protein [Legionella drozanskii]